jgi:8-amino-7-oxononanoate synthase
VTRPEVGLTSPEPGGRRPGSWEGPWAEWVAGRSAKARARHRWRELGQLDALGLHGTDSNGRALVLFSSNDYLGLSARPEVVAASIDAAQRWGTGAGAARLISGSRPVHSALEQELAAWKGEEAALVYPSGYSANVGAVPALAGPGVLVCSDALNHASLVDGTRLARSMGAEVVSYHHGEVGEVAQALQSWSGRALVLSDLVFSMDGDRAPAEALAEVCAAHGALLVLDEAHAVLDHAATELPCDLLRTGTLSKTLGSQGGFVAGPSEVVELLVNRSRSFMFTTALAPPAAAAALAALRLLRSPVGDGLVAALGRHAEALWPGRPGPSPIVPVPCGTEQAALAASAELARRGMMVPAVRPPTVPPGTSRLRVTLSAVHTDGEVEALRAGLADLGLQPAPLVG